MKDTELRIGNRCKWNKYASMGYGELDVNIGDLQYSELIEPITLTEEWLRQQGAVFAYPEIIIQGFIMEELGAGEFYFTGGEGVKLSGMIRTVHKLQNIYFEIMEEQELEIKK